MNIIVVVDKNWGIGYDGDLLVRLSKDMKQFKERTIKKTVVMGRTTLESLPGGKPLRDRVNIVLSRNQEYDTAGCIVCHSVEELLGLIDKYYISENVFIIGGGEVYHQLMPYCETIFVTKMNAEFEADVFFQNLNDRPDFEMVFESDPQFDYDTNIRYKFFEYKRKEVKDESCR